MADLTDDEQADLIKRLRREQMPHDENATLQRQNSNLRFITDVATEEAEKNFRKAHIDDMTGLPNQRAFNEFTERASKQVEQLTLIMGDLTQFKAVNDQQGHQAGNRVLENIGAKLQEYLWDDDPIKRLRDEKLAAAGQTITPFRIGGDEFALVLINFGREDAIRVADETQQKIAAVIHDISDVPGAKVETVQVGGAFGIASRDRIEEQSDLAVLKAMADIASYGAKDHGVVCVAKSPDEFFKIDDRLNLVSIAKPEREERRRSAIVPKPKNNA